MRSHQGRRRSGSWRRARPFRPGWDGTTLEDRLLLAAPPALYVPASQISIAPSSLPDDTVNTPYPTTTLAASGGAGGYTYNVTTGTLPTGLNLDSTTGILSGTPTAAGPASFTVTATDSSNATGSQAYSFTINPALAFTTTSPLPSGALNSAYSQQLATSGGTGTPKFALTSGTLPAGLNLSSAGLIAGTPTAAGTSSFQVTATDAAGATQSQAYTLTVNQAITLSPATLPNDTLGVPYSKVVSATGGSGGYNFAVSSGALPAGLTLNGTSGAITGTPTATGTSTFTVTATDSNNDTGSQAYTVTVNPAVKITTTSLPSGTDNVAYNQTIATTGGTGAITFAQTGGNLPAGLSLSTSTGAITGTPSSTGTSSFTVTATDSVGGTATQTYTVAVNAAVSITTTSLPNTSVGVPYSQQIAATGGTGQLAYTVSVGTLPPGLTLSTTGLVAGTPTTAGNYAFTVTATDSNNASASQQYTVTVSPKLAFTTTTLPNGSVAIPYDQQISAIGGTGALTYSVPTGALPGGLSLSSAGVLSGTPNTAGTSNFTVTVTDSAGVAATQPLSLTIQPAGNATGPTVTSVVRTGVHHQNSVFTITFSSALDAASAQTVGNYTIQPFDRAMPSGFAVPIKSAVYNAANHTVTLTAAGNVALNRQYALTINGTSTTGVKGTSGAYLAGLNGQAGTNYVKFFGPEVLAGHKAAAAQAARSETTLTTAINNSGLTVHDVYSLVSHIGSPGILDAADLPLAVRIRNLANSHSPTAGAVLDTVLYKLEFPPPVTLALSPITVPNDTVGVAYNRTIAASGGTGGYSFAVTSGSLPAGLSLGSSTGAITGTPTTAGTSNFTITATDSSSATGSQPYTIVINPAVSISTSTLPAAAANTAYSQTISATGGTGALTFAVTTGALPAGLTLNGATGVISGTPTATGAATFAVTATDTVGATASANYTLTVNQAIAVAPATLPNDTVGNSYSATLTATGGAGGYHFGVTAGALPAGLTLNATSGVISGAPTATGSSSFTVTATDTTGSTGSHAYTVTINPAVTITTTTLPGGAVNTPYNQPISATGGTGSLTFSLVSGTLPAGLDLANGGVISGTPTASGTSNFTVKATDSVGASATQPLAITIA